MGFDGAVPREHHVRGEEDVVANNAMVADMIAAPNHYVVADGDERLNSIVFEDETILARMEPREVRRPAAHICD
jgi:hypothetical protein